MALDWQRISVLPTIKAYPSLSRTYGEAVCVAGIRTDLERPAWVRLYPLNFRELPISQQFGKYQMITLEAAKHSTDKRPETMRPNADVPIVVGEKIGTDRSTWKTRRSWIDPLLVESMCEVRRLQTIGGTSLAAFRPHEVLDLIVEPADADWDDAKAGIAGQGRLGTRPTKPLEKIPFQFKYHFRCGPGCGSHKMSIIDWEICESWREWRKKYGDEVVIEKIRQRWLDQMCAAKKDTIFLVGNMLVHPSSFLVLGVFWPNRT